MGKLQRSTPYSEDCKPLRPILTSILSSPSPRTRHSSAEVLSISHTDLILPDNVLEWALALQKMTAALKRLSFDLVLINTFQITEKRILRNAFHATHDASGIYGIEIGDERREFGWETPSLIVPNINELAKTYPTLLKIGGPFTLPSL